MTKFVVLKVKKVLKQHRVICRDLCCFLKKEKSCEIFLISTEEQIVHCMHHTRGFIQKYFLVTLLKKSF